MSLDGSVEVTWKKVMTSRKILFTCRNDKVFLSPLPDENREESASLLVFSIRTTPFFSCFGLECCLWPQCSAVFRSLHSTQYKLGAVLDLRCSEVLRERVYQRTSMALS